MPLVSAKDFDLKSINDISGITNALSFQLKDYRDGQKAEGQQKALKLIQERKDLGLQFNSIRGIDDNLDRRKALALLAQRMQRDGLDNSVVVEALNITDYDQQGLFLAQESMNALSRTKEADRILAEQFSKETGAGNKLQFGGQEMLSDEDGNLFFATSKRNPQTGAVEPVLSPIDHNNEVVGKLSRVSGAGLTPDAKVKQSRIIAGDAANIDVRADEQKVIAKLKAEQEFKPKTAKQIELSKASAKKAEAAFVQVDKIQANILNLQDTLAMIEDGADTGPIARMFPSIRASSVALDNMQGRLGLDVVGAVTFGALSKGELDLAKSVALPTGLDGPELITWVENKIVAQTKLMKYFEEQAVFLSEGNSQADWTKHKKAEQARNAKPANELTDEELMEALNGVGQ